MATQDNSPLVDNSSAYDGVPTYQNDLFNYSTFFTLVLPVVSTIGVVSNLLAIVVLCKRNMRSPSTILIAAQLVVDILVLISQVMVTAPAHWMMWTSQHFPERITNPWASIKNIQNLFMGTVPLLSIVHTLSVWYALLLVIEQYMALTGAQQLARLTSSGNWIKTIIGIMNIAIIVNFFALFKYVQRDVRYYPFPLKRVCMSELRTGMFGSFERYLSPFINAFLPYVLVFGLFFATIVISIQKRKADGLEYEAAEDNPAAGQTAAFKGGRSQRVLFTFTFAFLLTHGAINVINIGFTFSSKLDILYRDDVVAFCNYFPLESRFVKADRTLVICEYAFRAAYAALKLPLLLLTGKQFRDTMVSFCRRRALPVAIPTSKKKSTKEEMIIQNSIATGTRTTIPLYPKVVDNNEFFLNSSKHGPIKVKARDGGLAVSHL